MGKITIKELSANLRNNISEKSLFFKELYAKEFLIPFQKENLLNFTDEASYWVVQYLERIYCANTKDTILEIVNENIKLIEIQDISYSTYYQLVKLIGKFDIVDINKIDYCKLLKHKHSIELVKYIYKKEQILEYKDLIKATMSALLIYEVESTSFDKKAVATYETYYLYEIINDKNTKEIFKKALSQEFIFDYLLSKYNEVYLKTHTALNNITDIFDLQRIDIGKINANFANGSIVNDISYIILYFLCVNLNSGANHYCDIKKLLSQRIFILRKLGLCFIYMNLDKYIDLLKEFFLHINKRNIVKVTGICLYELVKIFRKIDKIANSSFLNNDIKAYLDKFPKKNERIKYNVLHGLKENSEFKHLFYELKEKFQYENDNPGIYWQSGVGGWVKNTSPISEEDLKQKSIKEQIEYLNSNIAYDSHLIQIDKESVEEINERGLIDLFKKIVSKNINIYLEDDSIINLNKISFIQAFLEVISENIDKIKSISKVVFFIDNVFDFTAPGEYNNGFLYELISLNLSITNKRHKDFRKIMKYIEQIAKYDYDESYYKNEEDIGLTALNTMHGRNFRCFMEHLAKIRKLNDNDKFFLEYILKEENEDRLYSFYYYLGMQYDYLSCRHKDLHLLERVYKLQGKAKQYFLCGYLSYFCHIPQFKDLESLILKAFMEDEIKEGETRTRFVRMLIDLDLRFGQNKVFEMFSEHFVQKDYQDILNHLIYRENLNYSKTQVMEFWEDVVKFQDKSYACSLLSIFNRYCDIKDIETYEEPLKSIIRSGLPESLIANRGVANFLEKLLCFMQAIKNSAIVYNIITVFISSMINVKYLYKEIDIIVNILNEFERQNKIDNAKLVAQKMYEIPCLKFHVDKYKKFLV